MPSPYNASFIGAGAPFQQRGFGAAPFMGMQTQSAQPQLGPGGQPQPAYPQQPAYQPMQANPYLAQQAQGIQQSLNQNLQNNILPQVNNGSMAAGGFGDTRHAITQGLAIQGVNRDAANAMANLYGQAYESDANRALQGQLAQMQNQTALRGQDIGQLVSLRGQDSQAATTMRGQDIGQQIAAMQDLTNMHGQQLQAQTGRYVSDNNFRGSVYGADRGVDSTLISADASVRNAVAQAAASRYSADRGLEAARMNADLQRVLGLGNLDVQRMNAATNAQQAANQYQLGQGQLGLGYHQANQSYGLGLGNLDVARQNAGTQAQQVANQYQLGQGQLALGNRTADQNYDLGLGQLNNAMQQTANQYQLGQGQLALGNRNADISGAQAGSQIFTNAVDNGIRWNNALYGLGQQELYSGLGPISAFNNAMTPWMNATGTGTNMIPGTGGGFTGMLGGALAGWQFGNLFGGGPNVGQPRSSGG